VGPVLRVLLEVTHAGWRGVDMFFALSGLLITRILLETRYRPHYYRNFYASHVLRLAPPYFITLALVLLLSSVALGRVALSMVYLANFATVLGVPMVYGPLWSLAVEEHFYLIWPWLVRFLRRRTLFAIALTVGLMTPVFRYAAQKYGFFDPYISWFRFDGLLWGAMLALLVTSETRTRKQIWLWSTMVGTIGIVGFIAGVANGAMGRHSEVGSTFVFGLVAMATTGVIGHLALRSRFPLFTVLRHPVLRFLGNISYWVYLFHVLALYIALRCLPVQRSGWLEYLELTAILLTACLLTGAAVRRWIELPALAQKKYFR
jgi:peptidoglycan/LPS O-acetylase OafA/YrhL